MRAPVFIHLAWHLAEVGRWRLSKALGIPGLEQLRWSCLLSGAVAVIAGVMSLVDLTHWWQTRAPMPGEPVHMVVNIWIQLAIMVVAALITYALRPKVEPPQPTKPKAPVVEDGQGIREIFGPVWVDDSMQLAWRDLPPIPIQKKGGKK